MSRCDLNTHQEYDLKSVQFDVGTGKLQVQLSNPPASCVDGFFTSKAATLTVDPNLTVSRLTYTNHPVVLVPSKQMVQQVDSRPPSSFGFGTFLILALIVGIGIAWYKGLFAKVFTKTSPNSTNSNSPITPAASTNNVTENVESAAAQSSFFRNNASSSYRNSAPISNVYRRGGSRVEDTAPVSQTVVHTYQPAPVVVHDNGPGNFLTGMLVGQALSGNNGGYHHDTEIIHEREVIHDHDHYSDDRNSNSSDNSSRYSSDDDSNSRSSSSSYSSDDSNSSYSSDDSGSSYSSDSSSSYSSDISSSDSGSSFSSDF